jgi:hypothetical protein
MEGIQMQTADYKNYTITKLDSGTIEVTKDGHVVSPTRPLLREIAKDLNVDIYNSKGNQHITRQLGVLIMRKIQDNKINQNTPRDEEINTITSANINSSDNNVTTVSFADKIKHTIQKLQRRNISTFEDLLKDYTYKNKCGIFFLEKGEKIREVLVENNISNEYGVYLIYSIKDNTEELIYIGKSGTISQNGEFKRQGIKDRLKAVTTNNMQRDKYFQQEVIDKYNFDKLKFVWIITFDDKWKELPAYSESRLLQLYYDNHSVLPTLNRSF